MSGFGRQFRKGAKWRWLPANLRPGLTSNGFVEEKGKTEQWLPRNF